MKQKWIALLAVLCLMVTMVAPAVYADETTNGTESTTVRIEGESFAANESGLGNVSKTTGTNANASNGQFLDDMREGHVYCLGKDLDLTGLQSITLAIGHTGSGVEYGLYIDGTKGQMGYKIATIVGQASGGWQTFKTLTADIDVNPAILNGTHTLYLRVDKPITNSIYCGNLDYVDLTFGEAENLTTKFEMELLDGNAEDAQYRNRSNTTKYQKTYDDIVALDGTGVGNIFYLGDYDLTGLNELSICLANEQRGDVVYSFYIDGTKNGLGTKIASITDIKTGSWSTFKEYTLPVTVSPDVVAGRHTLWLALESKNGYTSSSGNFDYITFTQAAVQENTLQYAREYNFATAINKESSIGAYSTSHTKISEAYKDSETGETIAAVYSEKNSVTDTRNGAVLAYDNVSFDNLNQITIRYLLQGATTATLYKGSTDSEPLATLTLDTTNINGNSFWYIESNMRNSYFALDLPDTVTGTDTLYVVLETASSYAGNYEWFKLYYQETLSGVCTVQGEDYVWGFSPSSSWDNWVGTNNDQNIQFLNGTRNGDIFYLGKANVDTLQAITLRMATVNAATVEFYADMEVPWDTLTQYGNREKYTSEDEFTGGTLLGSINTTGTNGTANNWQDYSYFTCDVDTDLTGEHEIYMAMVRGDATDYTGNIDYIRLVGVSEIDTASNFPAKNLAVTFEGKFKEEIHAATVTSASELAALLETVKAPNLGGYTFCGWELPEDMAESIFDNYESYTIKPVYSTGDKAGNRQKYAITVGQNIAFVTTESEDGNYFFDDRVELKLADGVDDSVAYWVLDGQPMAYEQDTFTFYVTGKNEVSVMLKSEAGTYEKTASVAIQQYATSATKIDGIYTYTLSVIAQTYVPDDQTVEAFGVYYTVSKAELVNIQNGTPTAGKSLQVASNKSGNNEQYMTHLLGVKSGKTRYAMAYAEMADGTTKTYSTKVLEFVTDAYGNVTVNTIQL